MKPDDLIRLRHVADALGAAVDFVRGRRRGELDTDRMLVFALTRAIEIAGEAASKVSTETRNRQPQIPWAAVIGMRNRLVHAYFDINLDILWTTATEAGPALLAQIKPLLGED